MSLAPLSSVTDLDWLRTSGVLPCDMGRGRTRPPTVGSFGEGRRDAVDMAVDISFCNNNKTGQPANVPTQHRGRRAAAATSGCCSGRRRCKHPTSWGSQALRYLMLTAPQKPGVCDSIPILHVECPGQRVVT